MSSRDHVKSEIDTLPDYIIEKLQEFIDFQKFSLASFDNDKLSTRELEIASMSSTSFWDNLDDEVWDNA